MSSKAKVANGERSPCFLVENRACSRSYRDMIQTSMFLTDYPTRWISIAIVGALPRSCMNTSLVVLCHRRKGDSSRSTWIGRLLWLLAVASDITASTSFLAIMCADLLIHGYLSLQVWNVTLQ